MKIRYLAEHDADGLMKVLAGKELENFKRAFQCERDRMQMEQWALSSHERMYYVLEPYLFGFHPPVHDLILASSVARVFPMSGILSTLGGLERLLVEELVPLWKQLGARTVICTLSKDGEKLLRALRRRLPGIIIQEDPWIARGRIDLTAFLGG